MPYENLAVDRDGQIGIITLGRPEKLNAINRELHLEMMEACRELRDDDGVRVVIFTGKGRGFCSGRTLPASARRMSIPTGRSGWMNTTGWVGRP